MIDLTGPVRSWSERLLNRFTAAQERSLRSPSWWRTPAPRGEPALLERLAELFDAPLARTAVMSGVRQFAACWAGRTSSTVIESPTFADIPVILGGRGLVHSMSWDALAARQIDQAQPATIWLTSPFRNPDGRSLDPDLAGAVADLISRGHVAIINQVYRWFDTTGATIPAPANAWTVTSLAKIAGGGVRLGWITAPAADEFTYELTSGAPPTAWQRAWAAFLDRPTHRALWCDCVEPTLDARRAFADRVAQLCDWKLLGGGMSLMFDCIDIDEKGGMNLLAQHDVSVSPGSAFGNSVPSVRLAFSGVSVPEAEKAAEIIARLQGGFRPSRLA